MRVQVINVEGEAQDVTEALRLLANRQLAPVETREQEMRQLTAPETAAAEPSQAEARPQGGARVCPGCGHGYASKIHRRKCKGETVKPGRRPKEPEMDRTPPDDRPQPLPEGTRTLEGGQREATQTEITGRGRPHTHKWQIEPPNGPTSLGICACGAQREFYNSPEAEEEARHS